uniref:Uncharacterized protein n=1 Tax=Macrostomum lignano TaxID=282301 RepID=A0A1I8FDG0_9PLAT
MPLPGRYVQSWAAEQIWQRRVPPSPCEPSLKTCTDYEDRMADPFCAPPATRGAHLPLVGDRHQRQTIPCCCAVRASVGFVMQSDGSDDAEGGAETKLGSKALVLQHGQWLAAAPRRQPSTSCCQMASGCSRLGRGLGPRVSGRSLEPPVELQLENPCRGQLGGLQRPRTAPNAAERDQKPILPELRAPHVEKTEIALAFFSEQLRLPDSGLLSSTRMAAGERLSCVARTAEPCQTAVVLGSSPHWLVGQTRHIAVTSSACSIWNVSHSCRLLQADGASPVPLRRVESLTVPICTLIRIAAEQLQQRHQLQVSRSMAHQNWSVRCSVNQSGVVYDEAESLEQLRPPIFYPASIQVDASIESSRLHLAVAASDARP